MASSTMISKLKQEAQPVGSSLFCSATAKWFDARNAVSGSSLSICGLKGLGWLVSRVSLRLVAQCKLHSAFPFLRVTRVCQNQERLILDSDNDIHPRISCMSLFRQSTGTFALATSLDALIRGSIVFVLHALTCGINFLCGSFTSHVTYE